MSAQTWWRFRSTHTHWHLTQQQTDFTQQGCSRSRSGCWKAIKKNQEEEARVRREKKKKKLRRKISRTWSLLKSRQGETLPGSMCSSLVSSLLGLVSYPWLCTLSRRHLLINKKCLVPLKTRAEKETNNWRKRRKIGEMFCRESTCVSSARWWERYNQK